MNRLLGLGEFVRRRFEVEREFEEEWSRGSRSRWWDPSLRGQSCKALVALFFLLVRIGCVWVGDVLLEDGL